MFFNGFPPVCFGVVVLIIAGIGNCVNVAVGRLYVFFGYLLGNRPEFGGLCTVLWYTGRKMENRGFFCIFLLFCEGGRKLCREGYGHVEGLWLDVLTCRSGRDKGRLDYAPEGGLAARSVCDRFDGFGIVLIGGAVSSMKNMDVFVYRYRRGRGGRYIGRRLS